VKDIMPTNGRNFDYRLRGEPQTVAMGLRTDASPAGTRIREILHGKDKDHVAAPPTNGKSALKLEPENAPERPLRLDDGDTKSLTVLVADDHPIVREGLVALIDRQPDMSVVGEASNGQQAVEKYFALDPDIVLVDLRMPHLDGIEVVAVICEKDPSALLIVLTLYENEEDVYRSLRAGARGYAVKEASLDQLINCIHAVSNGKTWIPLDIGAKLAKRVTDPELTPRESEVLHAVSLGKSNKEIGAAFNISEGTVKVHMTHILEKLKVAGRTEAINVAVRRGLVRMEGAAVG
jgi:two-component system NarL family response regulator